MTPRATPPEGGDARDDDLLTRIRRGDEDAARELFERYAPLLRDRAARRLPEDLQAKVGASDVVQEALLSAFLALGDFDPEDPEAFKRWLLRILGNRLTDEIRMLTTRKRNARREKPLVRSPPGRDPTPSVVMMREEQRAALWRAVAELPADQQEAVRLVHFEQVGLAEAAVRLQRSTDAVRKLYSRALKRLAGRLGHGPAEEGPGDAGPPA